MEWTMYKKNHHTMEQFTSYIHKIHHHKMGHHTRKHNMVAIDTIIHAALKVNISIPDHTEENVFQQQQIVLASQMPVYL